MSAENLKALVEKGNLINLNIVSDSLANLLNEVATMLVDQQKQIAQLKKDLADRCLQTEVESFKDQYRADKDTIMRSFPTIETKFANLKSDLQDQKEELKGYIDNSLANTLLGIDNRIFQRTETILNEQHMISQSLSTLDSKVQDITEMQLQSTEKVKSYATLQDLNKVQKRIQKSDEKIAALTQKQKDICMATNSIAGQVKNISRKQLSASQLQQIQQQNSTQESTVQIDQPLIQQSIDIENLSQSNKAQLPAQDSNSEQSTQNAQQKQNDSNNEQITSNNEQVDSNKEQIDSNNEQIDSNKEQVDSYNEQIDSNKEQVESNKEQIELTQERVNSNNEQIDSNKEQIGSNQQKSDSNQEQINSNNEQIEFNKEQINSNQTNEELAQTSQNNSTENAENQINSVVEKQIDISESKETNQSETSSMTSFQSNENIPQNPEELQENIDSLSQLDSKSTEQLSLSRPSSKQKTVAMHILQAPFQKSEPLLTTQSEDADSDFLSDFTFKQGVDEKIFESFKNEFNQQISQIQQQIKDIYGETETIKEIQKNQQIAQDQPNENEQIIFGELDQIKAEIEQIEEVIDEQNKEIISRIERKCEITLVERMFEKLRLLIASVRDDITVVKNRIEVFVEKREMEEYVQGIIKNLLEEEHASFTNKSVRCLACGRARLNPSQLEIQAQPSTNSKDRSSELPALKFTIPRV